MNPHDFTELVLGTKCEFKESGRSSGSPADQELTFTFVPRKFCTLVYLINVVLTELLVHTVDSP